MNNDRLIAALEGLLREMNLHPARCTGAKKQMLAARAALAEARNAAPAETLPTEELGHTQLITVEVDGEQLDGYVTLTRGGDVYMTLGRDGGPLQTWLNAATGQLSEWLAAAIESEAQIGGVT